MANSTISTIFKNNEQAEALKQRRAFGDEEGEDLPPLCEFFYDFYYGKFDYSIQ
jgi:hypothetical protein